MFQLRLIYNGVVIYFDQYYDSKPNSFVCYKYIVCYYYMKMYICAELEYW